MKALFRRLKVLDYLIFASIITAALWAGFFLYADTKQSPNLIIEAPGGKWIYALSEPRTVTIPGALGTTTIRIEDNTAFTLDSPCPNKTCIHAAVLKKSGDWNACLPNKVFLHIEGRESEDIIMH